MGCGTGSLGAGATFVATLTFNEPIDSEKMVYQDFKSALFWLLQGLPTKGTMNDIEEVPPGPGDILQLKVTVHGPLPNPEHFNRAFNRLLWGVRHQLHDGKAKRPGTSSPVNVTASPDNWINERT